MRHPSCRDRRPRRSVYGRFVIAKPLWGGPSGTPVPTKFNLCLFDKPTFEILKPTDKPQIEILKPTAPPKLLLPRSVSVQPSVGADSTTALLLFLCRRATIKVSTGRTKNPRRDRGGGRDAYVTDQSENALVSCSSFFCRGLRFALTSDAQVFLLPEMELRNRP